MKKIKLGLGQRLYTKAKLIIPGGTQLLSKRPEMFLPDLWPAYYSRAKGCEIWDLDGNHYFDMSIMGIGACVLGYANSKVNKRVKFAINNGSMATLNSYEEVELAEKLLALHPWADAARFTRSGGEACAVAVRIARAYSKRDKVAFCGYHGWHDWYLSANLTDDKALDGQLLPGLEPAGVPRSLKNSNLPFTYGKIEELEEIVKLNKNEIGVIYMEFERHHLDLNFLKQVKTLAKRIGAVLVYDEVSSGFREYVGGMHMKYDLYPDICVLGKALGNGHPIGAVIGTQSVMSAAQKTFISSTSWTERVGFAASLETISVYEEKNVIEKITRNGKYLIQELEVLIKKHGLNVQILGLPSIVILSIKEKDPLVVKTVFTQEMLKRGFLASTVIYVSIAHKKVIIDEYIKCADEVLSMISAGIKNKNIRSPLEGPVCHAGFKRLN